MGIRLFEKKKFIKLEKTKNSSPTLMMIKNFLQKHVKNKRGDYCYNTCNISVYKNENN